MAAYLASTRCSAVIGVGVAVFFISWVWMGFPVALILTFICALAWACDLAEHTIVTPPPYSSGSIPAYRWLFALAGLVGFVVWMWIFLGAGTALMIGVATLLILCYASDFISQYT